MNGSQITIGFGAYELVVDARELWRDGRRVRVPPQAMRILIELTADPGAIVTRDHLRAVLWPDGTYVEFETSLNTAVRKLRAALGDKADRPRYLQTVPGRGYRFIAPVRHMRAPAPESPALSRERESRTRELAVASALACAAAAAIVLVFAIWTDQPRRQSLVIRAVPSETSTRVDGRTVRDATVASLQAIVGRLDPARLVVTDTPDTCHALTVATLDIERETASRVAVRLLDTCRHEQMWATTADVEAGGQLDAGILRAASRAIADQMLGGDRSARDAAAAVNGAALDAYRRGRAASRARRIADLGAAVEALETAVRLDPEFGPAWAALARTRATRAVRDGRDPSARRLAEQEATHALALDRELADAHVAIGQVRFARDRDLATAEAALLRARALGATAGSDVVWYACVLNAERRFDDALRTLDEAIAREPRMAVLHAWRGLMLHALRRYDDEMVALQRAAALDPQSPEALFHLGMGYARRRQYALALPALRQAVALSGDGGYYLSWFGRMAADAGDLESAERSLHELEGIARTRGLAPTLSGAVAYHIDVRRHRSGDL